MSEKTEKPTSDAPDTDARKAEAEGKDTLTVEWRGEKFTLPRNFKDWPYLYTFEMEQGHSAVAFRHLLGDRQFARFVGTNPTNGDFNDFDVALGKALGASQGESAASSA